MADSAGVVTYTCFVRQRTGGRLLGMPPRDSPGSTGRNDLPVSLPWHASEGSLIFDLHDLSFLPGEEEGVGEMYQDFFSPSGNGANRPRWRR
jgi:hypothetical protein